MEITLTCGGRSAVLTTLGGELVSYRDAQGLEYIWQGDPASWTGRNPHLFPVVGKLRGGAVNAMGKECCLPQHGFARHMEFAVAEQGGDYAVLELRDTPDTRAVYPFPFLLQVRHSLKENSFTTAFTVTNTGSSPLPFCLGGHTAFRCPRQESESFSDYQLVFEQREQLPALLPTENGLLDRAKTMSCLQDSNVLPLDYAVFDRVDTLVFDGLHSQSVSLRHKEYGHGIQVDFHGFPMLAFWTPPHKRAPFLCIEPWQGCAAYEDESGRFEDKPYAVLLAPGDRWSAAYTATTL